MVSLDYMCYVKITATLAGAVIFFCRDYLSR